VRLKKSGWVCSHVGVKWQCPYGLPICLAALAAILAVVNLSGCAGVVSGNTQAPSPTGLSASPNNISFGDVEVGTSSTQTITFSNASNTSLTVSQAAVSGAAFTMGALPFPLTLAAGQSSSLNLQFAPTATDNVTGSVTLISSASNSPTQIALSGRGVKHQLSAAPGSVSFGTVAVGTSASQSVILTNSGTASLSISQGSVSGAGFSFNGLTFPVTLNPGQSTNFAVQFAPTSVANMSGNVSLNSNAHNSPTVITVSGTGIQGALSANPPSVNFGSIPVGSSGSAPITVTNSGTASVTISQANPSGTGFRVSGLTPPLTINAGQSTSFTATFSPTSSGAASGNISITSNAPGSPLAIALNGTGTQPGLAISQTTVNFGNVNLNNTGSQNLSLTNAGNAPLIISQATVTGTGFSIVGLSVPQTINAGASVSFTAQFAPASTGSAAGSISITSNAPGSTAMIGLSGTGVQGQLTANPSSFNFGNILVGSSASQSVTLTNSGTSSVTISQANTSGTGFSISGLTPPLTINAGQSTSFTATFSPTSSGAASGNISITSNAPGSPLAIALNGTGTQPQLAATPSSASFGNVVAGTSNSQTITLTNSGSASATISQANVSGAGFSISSLTLPVTIAAGKSATFNVVFAPNVTGTVNGSVSLVSNAPGSPLALSLSGTGVAATFLLGANPTSLSFGNVTVGSNSSLSTTLTNNGNSNVTISGVTVTGAGFSANGVTSGTVLTPNQSIALNTAFAPTGTGSLTGSVSVASDATNSPVTLTLAGTGQPATPQTGWITGFYSAQNGVLPVSSIPWSKYTHINHFAAAPGVNGTVAIGYLAQNEINALVASRPVGKKVLVVISDGASWTSGATSFAIASNSANMVSFVNSIVGFVNINGYDGVDLDWEQGVITSQYDDLLSRLRAALPGKVIAVDMGNWGGLETVAAASQASIDQINLMCYDMDAPGNGFSWYNDALFQAGNSGVDTCDWRARAFTNAGVAPSKIGVGIPFYGRRWPGVTHALVNGSFNPSSVLYRDLVSDGTRWQPQYQFYDSVYKADYLSIPGLNEFDSYNGTQSIKDAVVWQKSQGFGGFMTFTIDYEYLSSQVGDARYPLSTTLCAQVFGACQ
jgi:hypothetical protein